MQQLLMNNRLVRAQGALDTLTENFKDLWPVMNKLVPKNEQNVMLRCSKSDSGTMEFALTKMHAILIGYLCWEYDDELSRDAAYLKFLQSYRSLCTEQTELIFNLYLQMPVEDLLQNLSNKTT